MIVDGVEAEFCSDHSVYSTLLPRFHSKRDHRSGALGAELAAERLMGGWPVVLLAGCEVSTHNSQPLRS